MSMTIVQPNMPIRMAAFLMENEPRIHDGDALAWKKARSSK